MLPIVLDTCTILNLLRIDEDDEFLYKKLTGLNINICKTVYDEIFRNVREKTFSDAQIKYISSHTPHLGIYVKECEKNEQEYKDSIRQFCKYNKENGEFYSTLISLYICRKENCHLFFYTDDYPAKCTFDSYFNYQQIGAIGDTVDLLVFLYWSNPDFQQKKLEKYLQSLLSEFATPFTKFKNQFKAKKNSWINNDIKNKKLKENLNLIESGLDCLDSEKIEKGITYFKNNAKLYKEINAFLDCYSDINLAGHMANKIKNTIERLREHCIYKMLC